ncbi:hypothetical protein [Cupriavidus sp. KK10]|uniref:hypothetical protein n=1 Tax=Cupriavidus sp. KK10 TaxID=1478019 RepID=UPI002011D400|nr:hypothetical protein [Cupriavidus sp. KK10]
MRPRATSSPGRHQDADATAAPAICFLTGTLNVFGGAERMAATVANELTHKPSAVRRWCPSCHADSVCGCVSGYAGQQAFPARADWGHRTFGAKSGASKPECRLRQGFPGYSSLHTSRPSKSLIANGLKDGTARFRTKSTMTPATPDNGGQVLD